MLIRNILIVVLFFFCSIAYSQKKNKNPFQRVNVPDSIYHKLEASYKDVTSYDNVNAGRNVWSLTEPKEFLLNNGVFSYQGQGPHFPRLIFIFYNEQTYIFKTAGYINFVGVLQEYITCITQLKISNDDGLKYLKVIAQYLEDEKNETYGSEVKEEEIEK